jgi:hypothetical protein
MTSTREPDREAGKRDGASALAVHVEECQTCRTVPPPVERIAAVLRASTVALDAAALSARTLAHVRPELERRASAARARRIAAGVLLALLPLPVVLAYDAYLLLLLYHIISALLPTAVATYLVLSEAAALALLFAATYAAIPIVLARPGSARMAMPG